MGYIASRVITPDSLANPQPLARAVQELSRSVVSAQLSLDMDYAPRIEEFVEIQKMAARSGFEALAKSLAPAPICLANAEIEFQFVCSRATEREFSIRVLNACWMSRFQSTASKLHSIRFEVIRNAIPMKTQPDVQHEEIFA